MGQERLNQGALPPAQIKKHLVAGQSPGKGDQNHPGDLEVSHGGGEPGQDQKGFSLEKGPYQERWIAIGPKESL
jgi:hypothetical protein